MAVGATDAHRYEEICDTCLRCSPFMTEPAEAASGVHGTNERLLVRSYLQGIRVLIDLMEHANVEREFPFFSMKKPEQPRLLRLFFSVQFSPIV